ncbi:MAG: formate dehydrogenase subunit gamma, partial [Planctomycetes bacterium]|nr:formate dehydrogenase subunit gamma [Planctomycetota bacterium]
PNHEILGYSRRAVAISAWRESTLKPAGPWFLAAVVLGCLLHLVIFGRRRLPAACAEPMVVRHGRGARLGHLLALATFLFLAATGVSFLLGKASPLGDTARQLHGYAGYAFAAGVVVVLLVWVKSAWFASYDWRWLRHLGGYFGFMGPLRAGKFNLGQKIFFWLAVVCGLGLGATGILMHQSHEFAAWLPLVYTIHDALAIVLVALVLAHAYLGLVAVPGSTSAIFEGGVSAAWARHHHPDWTLEPPVGLERRSAPEEK